MPWHKLLLFLFLPLLHACSSSSVLRQTGYHQRIWAIGHPCKVSMAMKTTRLVLSDLSTYKYHHALDTFETGGLYDAFRHLYWSAKLTAAIGSRKASRLLEAHEKDNHLFFCRGKNEHGSRPDSMQCVMDRLNNECGIEIGKTSSPDSLVIRSLDAIKLGKAYMLNLNGKGQYLDCNGNLIDRKLYKEKWYIPVCLKKTL
jgi:hypothetical protein